jgi:senataxin
MMISSESDYASEDDLDRELFGGVSKAPRSSDAFKAYQESKAQSLRQAQQQGPVKKSRQIRSAKDMRARLAPDLSSLHKTILSWDFFYEGDFPPSSERHDYSLVSSLFKNPRVSKHLRASLILEAWQGSES